MSPKKAKSLRIEEDDDWGEWEDDEEEDDIIDDEDDSWEDDEEDEEEGEKKPKAKPSKGKNIGKKAFQWSLRGLIVILIALLLFMPGFPFHEIRDMTGINSLRNLMRPYLPFPEWVNATVTLQYDLSISNGDAEEVEIHVAPPFDIPYQKNRNGEDDFLIQDVLDVKFSPSNHLELKDWKMNGTSSRAGD